MKNTSRLLVIGLALSALFAGCKKDYSNENFDTVPNIPKPDFTKTTLSSVSGFITDAAGNPVENAVVLGGSQNTLTDEFGYFTLENVVMPEEAGFVKVSKTGFFDGFRTFETTNNSETFVRIEMIPRVETGTFNGTAGGTVQTADGAKVTLPANSVVNNATGVAYTGTVHVAAHWLNPTGGQKLSLNMPGDLRGLDTDGYLRGLETFGMVAVELTDDGGQKLQIAPGKKATITFPIPAALQASAPASIAFWSFNETNGLWKQEGTATKTGTNYIGEAGHFSFWNCDAPFRLVRFKAQIVNQQLVPIAHVHVRITKIGSNGPRFGFSDSLGIVKGPVPANSQLLFEILSNCGDVIYSQNFTTTTANVDLGTITVNMATNTSMVTITGLVNSCANQPLVDGTIYLKTNRFVYRIPVKNGVFRYNFVVCNTSVSAAVATYVVIDNIGNQQSPSHTVTLIPGVNNLGTITACGTTVESFINYKYDSLTYRFTVADSMYATFNNNVTSVNAARNVSGTNLFNNISFSFTGPDNATGTHNLSFLSFNAPVRYTNQSIAPAVKVTVTEFGSANQFIRGSFSMVVKDSANANHNFECTFRVRRI